MWNTTIHLVCTEKLCKNAQIAYLLSERYVSEALKNWWAYQQTGRLSKDADKGPWDRCIYPYIINLLLYYYLRGHAASAQERPCKRVEHVNVNGLAAAAFDTFLCLIFEKEHVAKERRERYRFIGSCQLYVQKTRHCWCNLWSWWSNNAIKKAKQYILKTVRSDTGDKRDDLRRGICWGRSETDVCRRSSRIYST